MIDSLFLSNLYHHSQGCPDFPGLYSYPPQTIDPYFRPSVDSNMPLSANPVTARRKSRRVILVNSAHHRSSPFSKFFFPVGSLVQASQTRGRKLRVPRSDSRGLADQGANPVEARREPGQRR